MTQTFTAKSGNVALIEIKGIRGDLQVVDVEWDHRPSKKDMRECDAWWASRPEVIGVASIQVGSAVEARAIHDEALFGGQRN